MTVLTGAGMALCLVLTALLFVAFIEHAKNRRSDKIFMAVSGILCLICAVTSLVLGIMWQIQGRPWGG